MTDLPQIADETVSQEVVISIPHSGWESNSQL